MSLPEKKPKVNDLLNSEQYKKVAELDHDSLAPFVMENLNKQNIFTLLFKVSVIAVSATVLSQIIIRWDGGTSFLGLLAGVAFTYSIGIFVHELLHLLAYLLMGATKLSIIPKWSQGAVVATADHFVLGKKGFYFLAMMPFLILTIAAIFGLLLSYGFVFYMLLSFLFFHTISCIGDFGLASYFYENRHRTLFTFDDMKQDKSYFFEFVETEPANE